MQGRLDRRQAARGDSARLSLHRHLGLGAAAVAGAAVLALVAAGCAAPVRFPPVLVAENNTPAGHVSAYDTNDDKKADYFTLQDPSGRIVRIAYDQSMQKGEPDSFVNLDAILPPEARHIVFILDGIGYDMVEEFRKEGRLRLFHPPIPVISTYPAMTDIALADVFQSVPVIGFEAVHFDHQANRLVGGDSDYLSLKNEDWARHLDYRAGMLTDPLAYLYPGGIFGQELDDVQELFDQRDRSMLVAYLVSTAGLGTRQGREGQRKALDGLDRLCEDLVRRTRGLVKITMFSDHGHTLTPCKVVNFRGFLAEKGWRVADRLEQPRDVVPVEYGIITYASFATRDRAGLAADLINHPGVDLVTYGEGDRVVVERPDAKAYVECRGGKYRYVAEKGDPLALLPIVGKAKAANGGGAPLFDAEGFASDATWFKLTYAHAYPDPLDRLWRAFHNVAEHVPDVVADLKEGYGTGMASRAAVLSSIASTHGDLKRKSSTAVLFSTVDPHIAGLEKRDAVRSRDLPPILEALTGRPWPPPAGGNGKK